jgi:hypothetical protein
VSVDDETLSAFAEGQLPPEKVAVVAAAVAADPELAARLERLRALRGLLGGVKAEAPTPRSGLMAAARRAVAGPGPWIPALAAGVAGLAVGLAATFLRSETGLVDLKAGMAVRGALEAALDETASGMDLRRDGAAVSPLYTVIAADGRPCRVFRVSAQTAFEGAACREGGAWRLQTLAPVAIRGPGFDQASTAEPPALAAAMDAIGAGDPLAQAAEAELMAAGWGRARE